MDEETEDRELSNMPKFPWLAKGRARIELQIFQIKLLGGRLPHPASFCQVIPHHTQPSGQVEAIFLKVKINYSPAFEINLLKSEIKTKELHSTYQL